MGNDGGSIPTRRELVKEAARNPSAAALKESQQEQQEYLWKTDPISQTPLAPPIVSDCTGKLYNKDVILEFLVSGTHAEEAERVTRGSIKSLKDVVEVLFESDNDKADVSGGEHGAGTKGATVWRCPITGDRLGPPSTANGGTAGKAVYLVPCGHAFSASAMKEVAGEKCVTCETAYAANDVVPILPTSETDIARLLLRAKTLKEKGLTHSLKKAAGAGKKRKKRDTDGADVEATMSGSAELVKDGTKQNGDVAKVDGRIANAMAAVADGINNSATASLTAKVLQEGEMAKKRRRENENVRSLFSDKDQSNLLGKNADFMTRGFSVPGTTKR